MRIKITRSHFYTITIYQGGTVMCSIASNRGVRCIEIAIDFLKRGKKGKMLVIILIVVYWFLSWNDRKTTKALEQFKRATNQSL